MDGDFPSSVVIIEDDVSWNEFCSELLPAEQPDSYQLGVSIEGLFDVEPIVQDNLVISDNNVGSVNQQQPENHDFNNCMEQIEIWKKRAMMKYKEKESALDFDKLNQVFSQQEIKQRDETIARLQQELEQEKIKQLQQATQNKQELYRMGKLVYGYRKQLVDANRKFQEYRENVHNFNSNLDNASGSRGPVLSTEGHALTYRFH